MRVVVAGGSGFLGSHLCEALLRRGDSVCCLDDFSSGRTKNIAHLLGMPAFDCTQCDVTTWIRGLGDVDAVVHLAGPGSPYDYQDRPLRSLAVGSRGTENLLRLALRHRARFVLASTSEVYGTPEVHPQDEDYRGNVDPVGPRGVHAEATRYAEALCAAYGLSEGADIGIVRIFSTYGPRMRVRAGRVVSTFITQALAGEALTVFGDGSQTRSFCYVDDMVRGVAAMIDLPPAGPFNLGSPEEHTVRELAELVLLITGSRSRLRFLPLPVDTPARRRPALTRAREALGWHPRMALAEGLRRTVGWFAAQPDADRRPQQPDLTKNPTELGSPP